MSLMSDMGTAIKGKLNLKQNAITGAATSITSSNLTASKVLVSDATGKVAAATTTSTELGYVSGVTSAIQTQMNGKAPISSPSFTGSVTIGSDGTYAAGSIFSNSAWGMIFRAKQASPTNAIFRWADAADTELFRWNGSALTCSITGNSATATKLTNSSGDWWGSGAIANVVGMLSWKNYGNGHAIFDASAGTAPNGTAVNNANPQNSWSATYPTLMGWNGSQTYGVRVDTARYAESCTGNSATATSVNGGSVNATTGTFSGTITANNGIVQIGSGSGTYRLFRYDGSMSSDNTNWSSIVLNNAGTYNINTTGNSGKSGFLDQNALNGQTTCNLLFWNTPAHAVSCREINGFSDAPNTGWWFIKSVRHSNSSNIWGTQIAYGWEDNANQIWQRNVSNSSWSSWKRVDSVLTTSGSAPSYACRAWVNFNGTGTVAIRASGNVSSITDNGTGQYTVNFTTAMDDANYSANVSVGPLSVGADPSSLLESSTYTASGFKIYVFSLSVGPIDRSYVCCSVFR